MAAVVEPPLPPCFFSLFFLKRKSRKQVFIGAERIGERKRRGQQDCGSGEARMPVLWEGVVGRRNLYIFLKGISALEDGG